jgi:phospholipid-translocating ATPase
MLDATYQSVICYFMVYLLFAPGIFVTSGGEDVGDRNRVGVYVACAAIIVVNTYILLNTYRWDWLMLLLTGLSTLLVFFWTGVWAASPTLAEFFYQAAAQVFSQPSFWAVTFLVVIVCLLPRFIIKFVQKVYFPYDVDIIREQVRQGKFKYLDDDDDDDGSENAKSQSPSAASSEIAKPSKQILNFDEEHRPLKAPSVAPTTTTHNARSQNGSDGTDYTRHETSVEPPMEAPNLSRQSFDRPRPSFDRMRASMDRIRPSFEASHDFTSAALLTRMESSHSFGPIRSRRSNFTNNAR